MAFVILLLIAFFLKIMAIVSTAIYFNKNYKNFFGSIMGSWCLIQISIIALMLILSFFNALTSINLWIALVLFNVCLIAAIKKQKIDLSFNILKSKTTSHPATLITATSILAIFIFFTIRSFYFFDSTWDALTYELTRIFTFAQAQSLFTIQPTIGQAIYCYAWNGELNALFYLLMTNNDQAVSFSNAEIWLFLCFSFAWLANIYKAPKSLCMLGGLVLSTAPVWLGLVVTVKGDLLMAAAFITGIGFLWNINKSKALTLDYIFVTAALGLASGSKSTALPFALLSGVQLFFLYFTKTKKNVSILTLLACVGIFLVGNARYCINLYQFNEPFKNFENAQFVLSNFNDNLIGVYSYFFDIIDKSHHWTISNWAFGNGLGYLSLGFIIWFILKITFTYKSLPGSLELSSKEEYLWKILTVTSLCISTFFVLCTLEWRPWSFRHYAPFFFIPLTYLFSLTASYIKKSSHQLIATCFWLIFVAANLFGIFHFKGQGETTPVPFETAISQSQMERKLAFHPYLWNDAHGNGLSFLNMNESKPENIIILNTLNSAAAPFWGVNRQNKITFVDSISALKKQLTTHHYDLIVLSPLITETPYFIGYQMKVKNEFWTIFTPQNAA